MIITCNVQYRFMLQVHTRCNIFGSYYMSEHDQNLCTSGTDDQQKPHRIMAKERLLKGDFGFISKFAINATMKRNNLACKNGIPKHDYIEHLCQSGHFSNQCIVSGTSTAQYGNEEKKTKNGKMCYRQKIMLTKKAVDVQSTFVWMRFIFFKLREIESRENYRLHEIKTIWMQYHSIICLSLFTWHLFFHMD